MKNKGILILLSLIIYLIILHLISIRSDHFALEEKVLEKLDNIQSTLKMCEAAEPQSIQDKQRMLGELKGNFKEGE